MLQVDLLLTDYLFGIFRTLYDLTDFASKSRSRYPPKLYSIPFHQNYSISPPTPVTENVSISEWYMYRPKVSGGFWGGGLLESSRILELPVHLFTSTLFHDISEINWFAATFFHIHNVDYLENKIQETFEELVHDEKYLGQPDSCETCKNYQHTNKSWFTDMLWHELVSICVLKVSNQPKGKRKHRPKESTEVKPVLAPVKIYDSSCLLPIQKELGKNYM